MRKNKMMRVASVLLIAVLLTTCAISGTFAKYVTEGSTTDKARVAKFGVTVEASSDLFAKNYVRTTNVPGSADLTVESSNTDNVVAPGTQSSADGMKLSVKGKPEVAVNVAFSVTKAEDIVLKQANGLPNKTGVGAATFDNAADYYPVKFTLKKGTTPLVTDGTLAAVKTALEATTLSKEYAANTDLSDAIGDLVLTWKWDFSDSSIADVDKKDTLLGDLAVDGSLTAAANYNLNTEFAVTISVTQVD